MVLMISVHSLCLQSSANVLWLLNLQLGVPLTSPVSSLPVFPSYLQLSPENATAAPAKISAAAVNSRSRAGQLEYLLGIAHVHRS